MQRMLAGLVEVELGSAAHRGELAVCDAVGIAARRSPPKERDRRQVVLKRLEPEDHALQARFRRADDGGPAPPRPTSSGCCASAPRGGADRDLMHRLAVRGPRRSVTVTLMPIHSQCLSGLFRPTRHCERSGAISWAGSTPAGHFDRLPRLLCRSTPRE